MRRDDAVSNDEPTTVPNGRNGGRLLPGLPSLRARAGGRHRHTGRQLPEKVKGELCKKQVPKNERHLSQEEGDDHAPIRHPQQARWHCQVEAASGRVRR